MSKSVKSAKSADRSFAFLGAPPQADLRLGALVVISLLVPFIPFASGTIDAHRKQCREFLEQEATERTEKEAAFFALCCLRLLLLELLQ
jgi:hypothetical protein